MCQVCNKLKVFKSKLYFVLTDTLVKLIEIQEKNGKREQEVYRTRENEIEGC